MVPEHRAGRRGRCPICGQMVIVPVRNPEPSPREKRAWDAGGTQEPMVDPGVLATLGFSDSEGSQNITPGIGSQFIVEEAGPDWPHQRGVVGEAELRAALAGLDPRRTAVMICGPAGMTTAVADKAAAQGVPLRLVHYERFDYAGGGRSRRDRAITLAFWTMAAVVLAAGTAFALRG